MIKELLKMARTKDPMKIICAANNTNYLDFIDVKISNADSSESEELLKLTFYNRVPKSKIIYIEKTVVISADDEEKLFEYLHIRRMNKDRENQNG